MSTPVYDYVIIGSGVGAGAFLTEVAPTGASILVVERGDYLSAEKENWDARELFVNRRYSCNDAFFDKHGRPFTPRMYYCVGGNSKVFGGSAFRFREVDFEGSTSEVGSAPAWPFSYCDIAPFYEKAERAMHVCGRKGDDVTEPPRDEYLHAQREHEPYVDRLSTQLGEQGLRPFHLPVAIDAQRCRKGSACDGYPCRIKAKHDAEVSFITPMVHRHANVELWTGAYVERLESSKKNGQSTVSAVCVKKDNALVRVQGKVVVVAAGAINSALLLLRSKTAEHPLGLANASGQVGRNYMTHINSVIIAVHPFRKNPTRFQKTLAINDYYFERSAQGSRLGSIQMRGKIKPENLQSHPHRIMRMFRTFISSHSADFWVMTEDYPNEENRVFYDELGRVRLVKEYRNLEAHRELIRRFSKVLKNIGYWWVHADLRALHSVQHQCGTIRCGKDKAKCPLDMWCKAFDVDNLYVVDASVFPSSAALNPALTVAANAMRVGAHLKEKYKRNTQKFKELV